MTALPNNPQRGTKEQIVNLLLLLILCTSSDLFLIDTAAAQPPPAGQVASQSGYRLIGILKGPELAGAVLGDAAGEQIFYRLRERLPDGSQVFKVRSDSIVLKRSDGMLYELYITHDTSTAVQAVPSARVSPAESEEVIPKAKTGKRRPGRRNRLQKPDTDE